MNHDDTFAGAHTVGDKDFRVVRQDDKDLRDIYSPDEPPIGWHAFGKNVPPVGPYPTARGAYEKAIGE